MCVALTLLSSGVESMLGTAFMFPAGPYLCTPRAGMKRPAYGDLLENENILRRN